MRILKLSVSMQGCNGLVCEESPVSVCGVCVENPEARCSGNIAINNHPNSGLLALLLFQMWVFKNYKGKRGNLGAGTRMVNEWTSSGHR